MHSVWMHWGKLVQAKTMTKYVLSGHFLQKQAKTKVVKIKKSDFSYWA